jgi:ATP-binding cassette subfamily C protein CydC
MAATTLAELLDTDIPGEPSTRRRLAKPATMVVLAFVFGAGLLGLAGWFIAASAVAGLAVTSTFSFLFPSAGVQALAWARTLARYGERITTHKATLDLVGSLRTSLFARALKLPRDRVAELRSSELLGRITVDSDAVENLLLRSSFPILAAITALIGVAVLFAWLSVTLALVTVGGLLLTGAVPVIVARYRARPAADEFVAARAQARHALIEALDGLPELRSFGAERRAADDVSGQLSRFAKSRAHLTSLEAGGRSVGILLADLTVLAVVCAAAGVLGSKALAAPAFVAVGLVAIAALEAVVTLPAAVTARAKARAAGARLTEVFTAGTTTGPMNEIAGEWPKTITIRLEDQDTELVLAEGETALITGASGSGKSTLLRTISGQPTPGIHVHAADVDVASIDPEILAQHITLVAQDAHIFDGTIRENLLLAGAGGIESSEPELWSALSAAALADAVAAFPAGLDTPAGAGGTALSGGQRRRLSVAQGLLRRPDVLLLDEPTEGLDTPTAGRLLAGARAFNPRTALVIALHDRQSPTLEWTPDLRLDLTPRQEPV